MRGSFSTPSNECKRVHTTTDRPTDARKRRERCSVRARENDTKNPLQDHARKPPVVGTRKNRDKDAQTKAHVSYLDDGAQNSRGWCNPPGASPDTINRSSRPRLSRANRRCPELRSVTRTPFTANLFGYVSVCELFLSRRRPLATSWWELPQRVSNFLSQRKRGTFSLCVCLLLPVSAAPRQIPLCSMDDPPVSLFNNNNALFCVCVLSVLWGEKALTVHPKTEASFRSVNCSGVGSVWVKLIRI